MAILHPAENEIARFATPLEPGERLVLDRLRGALDDQWHIFVQPHVLDLHPDFVLVAQHRGVTVIEVKDWNPALYRASGGGLEVLSGGVWERITGRDGDPLRKVHDYRARLSDRFVSPPGDDDFRNVRGTAWFVQHKTRVARSLMDDVTTLDSANASYVWVAGHKPMTSDSELKRVVWGGTSPPGGLAPATFERVLARLDEPEAIADQRRRLELSEGGQDIATNPHGAKVRRIRGPAGSGKSYGLAARAAVLAAEGKTVLVLSFNITLAHYLQDLVRREARHLGADHRLVDCIHFHGFCASIVDGDDADDGTATDTGEIFDAVVQRAQRALERGAPRMRYDAILVDEGQDFRRDWWLLLRQHVLAGQGEMAVVADATQDIFERSDWLEEDITSCGFRQWTTLTGSYRLPADLVPIVNQFGQTYLPGHPDLFPTAPALGRGRAHAPTTRRWSNLPSGTPDDEIARELAREVQRLREEPNAPHDADIALLTNAHGLGAMAADVLTSLGVHVESLFAEDRTERRRRKVRFWPGANAVKASTVHSFKGWEARAVVLALTESPTEAELAYVGLSRVKAQPQRSAFVTVINTNPVFESFKDVFERELTLTDVPGLEGQTTLGLG